MFACVCACVSLCLCVCVSEHAQHPRAEEEGCARVVDLDRSAVGELVQKPQEADLIICVRVRMCACGWVGIDACVRACVGSLVECVYIRVQVCIYVKAGAEVKRARWRESV